jgi:hypothetical protein
MALDWQVLAIAFIAISVQLLAGAPDLQSLEIDGQLPDRNSIGKDSDQNPSNAIDGLLNHSCDRT